jgi:hypothetical protein
MRKAEHAALNAREPRKLEGAHALYHFINIECVITYHTPDLKPTQQGQVSHPYHLRDLQSQISSISRASSWRAAHLGMLCQNFAGVRLLQADSLHFF